MKINFITKNNTRASLGTLKGLTKEDIKTALKYNDRVWITL